MPSTRYGRSPSDLRRCEFCEVRLIFSRTAAGQKMPPVEFGPDPIGTVAIEHKASGAYTGRFLTRDEQPIPPETRHAIHHCDGLERQHRHRRGRPLNQRTTSRPRHQQPTQPTLI